MYFGNYYDTLKIELQTHQVNMKVIHICQTAVKANHNEIIYVICYVPCVRCRVLGRTVAGKNSISGPLDSNHLHYCSCKFQTNLFQSK